jgi:cytochrome c biogenesis protein CcmG, thiol:disulfide interchange protein DsbE
MTKQQPNKTTPKNRAVANARANKGVVSRGWLFGGIAVVVVGAAIIALLATRGGDDSNSAASTAGIEQTRDVAVTGAALPAYVSGGTDAGVGTAPPQLSGATFTGDPVIIAPSGKPTIVFFVAHWCPHCQAEVPVITKWLKDNGGVPTDIDLFAVATGTSADSANYPPSSWLARENWPIVTMADSSGGTAAKAWGLSAYPYFVVVGKDGKVAQRATGELTTAQLAALFARARA